ncbi:hypothetical protein PM082_012705 [Marasmius tenuissimus]|nr:hypothetical protein PM082_012705 [Marasmius tenuissimus]
MKLFTVAAALASMATLASAQDQRWRARFYGRTNFEGSAIVDQRGSVGSILGCTNINPGGVSLRFEDAVVPPNTVGTDTIRIWTVPNCVGAPTLTYTGATNVPTLFPTPPAGPFPSGTVARSFAVN